MSSIAGYPFIKYGAIGIVIYWLSREFFKRNRDDPRMT